MPKETRLHCAIGCKFNRDCFGQAINNFDDCNDAMISSIDGTERLTPKDDIVFLRRDKDTTLGYVNKGFVTKIRRSIPINEVIASDN